MESDSQVKLQKWEYKTVGIVGHPDGGMAEAGKDGWELVTVITVTGQNYDKIAYFKRPLR